MQEKNSTNVRKRPNKPRRRRNRTERFFRIPTFTNEISVTKRFRYSVVTAGHLALTRGDTLNLIVLPTSVILAAGLLASSRIREIRVYSCQSSSTSPLGDANESIVTWYSTLGKKVAVRGTQMGIAPGFVRTTPPEHSLASFWTNTRSTLTEELVDIFTSSTHGTIVDITYDLVFDNGADGARTFAISSGIPNIVSYNNFGDYENQGYQDYAP